MSRILKIAKRTPFIEPVGSVCYFVKNAIPEGYLKLNGAALTNASYPELTDLLYVGDGGNASAQWGYRCTDPLNPSTTRDTEGAYTVLPDLRGEFVRVFDDGRGVDSGRSLHATQLDQFKSHVHGNVGNTAGDASGPGPRGVNPGGSSNAAGGDETRPRNLALVACIKY